ncbi:MAG: peptidylprolyl isomerase [Kiritimatiellia bacterium]
MLICGCGNNNELPPEPAPAEPPPDYVVAMVNDTPLTFEDMNQRARGFLEDDVKNNHLIIPENRMDEAIEHFRKRAIQTFVFKSVFLDKAIENGIKVTGKDRTQGLKNLAVSLKSRNWTTNDFFNNGPMPPKVMRKEFEDSLIIDKYINSRLSEKISLETNAVSDRIKKLKAANKIKRQQIEEIRQKLIAGADFEEMAKKHSECTVSKAKGGDLGEFGRGKMTKKFEDAAFSQKVGEIGPVITTPYGYHIIKVTSHSQKKEATESTPEIPETIRASHILIKHYPIVKKRIIKSLQKEKYEKEKRKLYRRLLKKTEVKCFLYDDIKF